MPELPDVETYKRYLDATSLHKEIVDVELRGPALLKGLDVDDLAARLKGRRFASTRRHGKWLLVELEGNGWLVLHFGMSGGLAYFRDMEKDPDYDRFLISFANGYHLAYDARRKLGEIALTPDPAVFIRDKGLGPDALDEDLDQEAFLDLLAGRRGMIKPALTDQALLAGIGSVYADEILFQARVHPRTPLDRLDEGCRVEIYHQMLAVLRTAIARGAEPDDFPADYLIPQRHAGGTCPHCGHALETVDVSGRTAYYCPHDQGREP